MLAAGSPVVAEVVERLAVGDRYATFLHPALDAGTGALRQVTALDCSNETADRLRAAVLLSPEPDLHGLSRHDLHVLGLVVAGWEDHERIATALTAPPRTSPTPPDAACSGWAHPRGPGSPSTRCARGCASPKRVRRRRVNRPRGCPMCPEPDLLLTPARQRPAFD